MPVHPIAEVSAAHSPSLVLFKRVGAGFCIILFPIMLLVGFATHPNILSFSMVTDLDDWIAEWRTSMMFHVGHLLVMFAVPFIIVACVQLASLLKGAGRWYGFVGSILGVFGAFMLAVDKGALTFVLTAFRDLTDAQLAASEPALQAIFDREGWLWITWAFATLPLGVIVLSIGLLKEKIIPTWQGYSIIAGLILLLNPDIEIISTVGATLMCVGFIPLGIRVTRGATS